MRNGRFTLSAAMLLISASLFGQAKDGKGKGQGKGAPAPMSFFVTSAGAGKGADLGGLAGADMHCQMLAAAVGRGSSTWHAYLSTQGAGAVNARDRIGTGPWANAKGQVIAANVAELHGDTLEIARMGNRITKTSALNEKGEVMNGVGDTPNEHDILTGSQPDGRAYTDAADHTCGNWTSSGMGTAQLGHFDRMGGGNASWNSVHASQGCSQQNLVATGGAGKLYCFAIN
ncbi:MAG: lectin [Bryobacteraceae bacterium]